LAINKKVFYSVSIIFITLFLDQLLKYWVKTNMYLGQEFNLIEPINWAKFHFVENNGIAFGLELGFPAGKIILTSFRLILAGVIVYLISFLIKKQYKLGFIIAVSLVFAGALGNIIDSIFYGVIFDERNLYNGGWFEGRVVDMFYFPLVSFTFPQNFPFVGGNDFLFFRPVFNLADTSISVGFLIIILFFRKSLNQLSKDLDKKKPEVGKELAEN
jgi:signal peptidase II